MQRLAIFGSTGSIGRNCLDVVRRHPDRLRVVALAANSSWQELAAQAREFQPQTAVLCDPAAASEAASTDFGEADLRSGAEAIDQLAASPEVDCVVAAIVGAAGLSSTLAAVESGKRVALANKETLVVAGPLVSSAAERSGAELLPVDSEHSAVFQAITCGERPEVKRVVLTASGGPFRGRNRSQLSQVTPEEALAHPTWKMGPKISIDSATMMNKALELIEARWLFDLRPDQLEVVLHPQSVVHSFVEFVDGSVMAQLSPPDMRLPIQYALSYPARWESSARTIDWRECWELSFEPPDEETFPALSLGREVATRGGTSGSVLNAANEAAVERFLGGSLSFLEIPVVCRAVLEAHDFNPHPTLDELFRWDAWGRKEVLRWRS